MTSRTAEAILVPERTVTPEGHLVGPRCPARASARSGTRAVHESTLVDKAVYRAKTLAFNLNLWSESTSSRDSTATGTRTMRKIEHARHPSQHPSVLVVPIPHRSVRLSYSPDGRLGSSLRRAGASLPRGRPTSSPGLRLQPETPESMWRQNRVIQSHG